MNASSNRKWEEAAENGFKRFGKDKRKDKNVK
jgi:hypothetical protein